MEHRTDVGERHTRYEPRCEERQVVELLVIDARLCQQAARLVRGRARDLSRPGKRYDGVRQHPQLAVAVLAVFTCELVRRLTIAPPPATHPQMRPHDIAGSQPWIDVRLAGEFIACKTRTGRDAQTAEAPPE